MSITSINPSGGIHTEKINHLRNMREIKELYAANNALKGTAVISEIVQYLKNIGTPVSNKIYQEDDYFSH